MNDKLYDESQYIFYEHKDENGNTVFGMRIKKSIPKAEAEYIVKVIKERIEKILYRSNMPGTVRHDRRTNRKA